MPILLVELVTAPGETVPDGTAAAIADAAAAVFAAPAGRTWVRLHALPALAYAEDGGGPPTGVRPVFVQVLKASVPDRPELEREATALAAAVARACHRPVENVHTVYEPPAAGRMAFGGALVPGP
jgi:hypothetical protein